MRYAPLLGRTILLALAPLSACAAAGAPLSPAGGRAGAYGNFLIGQYAASRFDFPVSADAMQATLANDPASRPVLAGRTFLIELLAGNTDAAGRLAAALPKDALAQLLLAGEAARAGHWPDALRRYETLPVQDGLTSVLKPLLVAWAQQGAGHTQAALATLQSQKNPASRAIFALHTALIADQAKLVTIAAQNYGIVQGALNITNMRLAQILASWDVRSGDPAAANQILDGLAPDLALAMTIPAVKATLQTMPVATATQGLAEVYVNLAAVLEDELANGQPNRGKVLAAQQTVMTLLQLGLQLEPDLSAARLLLSEAVDQGDNTEVALAPLESIPATDPLYPLAVLRRAALLARMGQGKQATGLLDTLATRFPHSPEPLLAEADILRGERSWLPAAALYTKALALLPKGSLTTWLVYYDRAMCYDQGGDWAKAEPDLQEALKLSPGQPYVLNYLAYSWATRKQHLAEAHSMIAQALKLVPDDGAVIDSLGYVELQQGQAAQAVRTLMRAVQLEPDDPTINAHLGDAYAAAGEHLQAVYQWRRAVQLGADAGLTKDLLAKLDMKQPTGAPAPASN
ncbi:tetratricopeptide repeat protein [Acidisoma sp. C75]